MSRRGVEKDLLIERPSVRTFILLILVNVLVVNARGEQVKEKWELSTPAEELAQMQGKWRVGNVQGNDNPAHQGLPKETGLTEEKVELVIEGNALLRDGKVIATLANDLSGLGIQDPALFRRPMLIVLPDGRALRCAYDKRHLDRSIDIAPPGVGNVGAGYRIYLVRR